MYFTQRRNVGLENGDDPEGYQISHRFPFATRQIIIMTGERPKDKVHRY